MPYINTIEPFPQIKAISQAENQDYVPPLDIEGDRRELIYSEKIENYLLKTLGKYSI